MPPPITSWSIKPTKAGSCKSCSNSFHNSAQNPSNILTSKSATVDIPSVDNAISDGGSTAMHSKLSPDWIYLPMRSSPLRAPCGANIMHCAAKMQFIRFLMFCAWWKIFMQCNKMQIECGQGSAVGRYRAKLDRLSHTPPGRTCLLSSQYHRLIWHIIFKPPDAVILKLP